MNLRKIFLASLFVLLLGVFAACSNKNDGQTDSGADEQVSNEEASSEEGSAGEELSGSVVIDGSGTVYPLMAKLAEEYMANEQPNVSVEVGRAGTSAGFKKFLVENGTDFNDASRPIKDEELEQAEELGIEVKEFKVALDGLTFVINPENDWATELTAEQLKEIFLASSSIEKWSDINPDWPDEKINTYGPNENHGTYEFFFENVLEEQDLKDDVNLQQEYSTLVNLISQDPYGIAFFGFGYYVNNQDQVKAVHVDFGAGPVEPSLDTIAEDGPYAEFTRPVFTYLNVNHAKEKPQVLDYAKFVINNINNFAGETGFAPLPEEEIEESLSFLESIQ